MKKPFIFILSLLLAVLMFQAAHAANTATFVAPTPVVSVVPDGSTNFDLASVSGVPTQVQLYSIVFQPSAANDKIQVRANGSAGPVIWPANLDVLQAGQVIYWDPPLLVDPYIVASECTFGTAANAKIIFTFTPKVNQ